MKVTFVISSLASGGAERVISLMANYWANLGLEITVVTLDRCNNDFFGLSPLIKRVEIDAMKASNSIFTALQNNYSRIKRLRKGIHNSQPDVVISFVDKMNILTLIACWGKNIPIIVSERTDPRYYHIGLIWAALRRIVYPFAGAVVVQTGAVKMWANSFLSEKKVHVIPNPIDEPPKIEYIDQEMKINKSTIMAVGRLGPEKGFDLLIKAFSRCLRTFPEWNMVILGEGSERATLENLIVDFELNSVIKLPGRKNNVRSLLQKCGMFVLSSRFEGFPNVLLEAMSCKLPVISFNCPSGPSDIITDGKNGILVTPEDPEALAEAMMFLMSQDDLRNQLAENAYEVVDKFHIDKIMGQWEQLIHFLVNKDVQ